MDHQSLDQSNVIAALRNPATYGPNCGIVEVIETHAGLIFLAGDLAFKIKKAVRFPYLDFSTVETRKAACEKELELNKPHAQQIYLDVVSITEEASGEIVLAGEGVPVEWAVRMRRFPDNALLSHAVDAGRVDAAFFDRLADEIAEYHNAAPVVSVVSGAGKIESIVDELVKAFRHAPDLLAVKAIEQFANRASCQLQSCADILNDRAARGLVRRCHGDLHLANIITLDDKPILFDAIEFNDDIATTDVLYDVAFLLMDLCHCHKPNFANRVLNRYLSRSREDTDLSGLKTLPLFMACRAGIRAMVAIARLQQTGGHKAEDAAEVLSYFGQANSYLDATRPRIVAVGGYSGTGKTSVARRLAIDIVRCPGAVHLRTDVERKQLFKVEETVVLSPESYTREASGRVYEVVFKKAAIALKASQSVVVDAVFLNPVERAEIERIAKDAGLPFIGIWLEADEETLIERVTSRHGDASDATADVVRLQVRNGPGKIDWHRVHAGGGLDETVDLALKAAKPCCS
jgi:aminoglycoside phosphotransferase family enzyme/predicted kinase